MSRVFSSLRQRSHSGEAMECGDGAYRVLHSGIIIESQDGEEANCFCACRASGHAKYPCPKCLVHNTKLYDLTGTFEPRTSESMRAVIQRASRAETKTDKEKILQAFGLHDIQVQYVKRVELTSHLKIFICSIFYGIFDFLTHTLRAAMISFIQMT